MKTREKLTDALVWEGEHLSELGVTAIADGQDAILPADALAHFAACDHCTAAVGDAALLALETHALIAHAGLESLRSPAVQRAKVPVGAVSLAIVVALVSTAPVAIGIGTHAATFVGLGAQLLSFLGHLAIVAGRGSPEITEFRAIGSYGAAALLMFMGIVVAKTQSQPSWK